MDKTKSKFERTVTIESFNAWQKFRRRKDGDTIARELGYSRPVIDRAINYGYVKTDGLADAITQFFLTRVRREQSSASELMNSQNSTPQTNG